EVRHPVAALRPRHGAVLPRRPLQDARRSPGGERYADGPHFAAHSARHFSAAGLSGHSLMVVSRSGGASGLLLLVLAGCAGGTSGARPEPPKQPSPTSPSASDRALAAKDADPEEALVTRLEKQDVQIS